MNIPPITGTEDALLRMINQARSNRLAMLGLADESGITLEDEEAEDLDRSEKLEEACMAHLESIAQKCPGCREAFSFQRQSKHPERCSWCGYDHSSGDMPQLVPA